MPYGQAFVPPDSVRRRSRSLSRRQSKTPRQDRAGRLWPRPSARRKISIRPLEVLERAHSPDQPVRTFCPRREPCSIESAAMPRRNAILGVEDHSGRPRCSQILGSPMRSRRICATPRRLYVVPLTFPCRRKSGRSCRRRPRPEGFPRAGQAHDDVVHGMAIQSAVVLHRPIVSGLPLPRVLRRTASWLARTSRPGSTRRDCRRGLGLGGDPAMGRCNLVGRGDDCGRRGAPPTHNSSKRRQPRNIAGLRDDSVEVILKSPQLSP